MSEDFPVLVERYLAGELDAADRVRLLALVEGDPALKSEFLAQVAMSRRIGAALRAPSAEDTWNRVATVLVRGTTSQHMKTAAKVAVRMAPRRRTRARRIGPWLALAAALVLAVFGVTWSYSTVTGDAQTIAEVASTDGASLTVWRGSTRIPATVGTVLRNGDRLSDPVGSAGIRFRDGTSFALTAGFDLTLVSGQSRSDGASKLARLDAGKLHAEVAHQPEGSPLAIDTPHSRITVIGTVFDVAVSDQATQLAVVSGRVSFADRISGSTVAVAGGGQAEAPVTARTVPAAKPAFPLHVAANGRYLVDQHETPFLWVGDAASSAIVMLSPAEMDAYLDDRAAKGFTVVQVVLIEHRFATAPPANAAGASPFLAMLAPGVHDFTTPNEAYFRTADHFIRAAAQRGLGVLLNHTPLGYMGGNEGWFGEMRANGRERMRAWGRWLGRRYGGDANLIWVNGKDFIPPADDDWVVEEVAQGIRDAGARQPMTIHLHRGQLPAEVYGTRSWFDLNNIFLGAYQNPEHILVQQAMRTEYLRTPIRPVFLMQGMYEPMAGVTAGRLRSQAYLPYVTGGCGQVFGNVNIDGFGTNPTVEVRPWRQELESSGSQDQARLSALLRGLAWWTLEPDLGHRLLCDGFRADDDEIAAASAPDGHLALVYVPSTGVDAASFTIAMDRFTGEVTARWFNPARGGYAPVAGSPFANHGSHVFTTPSDNGTKANDWLLVLTVSSP